MCYRQGVTKPQATATLDTWVGVWNDVADDVLAVHGGKLVKVADPPPPLDDHGIAPISYAERDAITDAWQRAVGSALDEGGKLGPTADAERYPALERVAAWKPPAGTPTPAATPGKLIPTPEAAQWWASTAQLALDLDAMKAPVTPFGVAYDLPTTPPAHGPRIDPADAGTRTPAPPAASSTVDAGTRTPASKQSIWPTVAVVALVGLVVVAASRRRRRRTRTRR